MVLTEVVRLLGALPLWGSAITSISDGRGNRGNMRRTWWERFWNKVADAPNGCWQWQAATDQNGYGVFTIGTLSGGGRMWKAHRLSYRIWRGSIPSWLQLDHLCRNRPCINPAHLELVTCRDNIFRGNGVAVSNAAKDSCPQGHSYTEANTYRFASDPGRRCRTCRIHRIRSWRKHQQEVER